MINMPPFVICIFKEAFNCNCEINKSGALLLF